MKLKSEVVALIPAWNEEDTITEVVRRTKAFIKDIVVIDDGSTDQTAQLAEKAGAKVIKHTVNLGKGEALNTGLSYIFQNTNAQYIIVLDADLQFNPEDAPRLLEPLFLHQADIVMGMRDFSKLPFRHKIGNLLWRTTFNLLFGTHYPDTNCGYFALTRKAAQCIKGFHGGYIIENDLLVKAIYSGLKLKYVPVSIRYRVRSNVVRGIRMVAGVLLFILVEGLKFRLKKYKG